MAHKTLPGLPDEIVRAVCFFLDWKDALSLGCTSTRFVNVTNEQLLWKHFCRTTFKYWASRHRLSRKIVDSSFVEWKRLFQQRREARKKTTHLLQGIITQQRLRIPKMRAIIELEYDAKDVLLEYRTAESHLDDYLARRYWSYVALGCLHRSMALNEWSRLKYLNAVAGPYVMSVGAFDLFVMEDDREGDLEDVSIERTHSTPAQPRHSLTDTLSLASRAKIQFQISRRLGEYAERIRKAHPEIDDQSPRQKASIAAQFLRANDLLAIPADQDYYRLDYNFLGRALFSQEKNSLPIISAIIYCDVLRQFGLQAAPCGFPFHVHVIVEPPDGRDLDGDALPSESAKSQSMRMDPFRTHSEISLSSLQEQLNLLAPQIPTSHHPGLLSASPPIEIIRRCARNIGNSLERSQGSPSSDSVNIELAKYAILWVRCMFHDEQNDFLNSLLVKLMRRFMLQFRFDGHLIEKYAISYHEDGSPRYLGPCDEVHESDARLPMMKSRDTQNPLTREVRFKIGQVFRHQRYNYTAVVTGWDTTCQASQQWINDMAVDRLGGGRYQPFYHCFVLSDKSTRYVAEENIELLFNTATTTVIDNTNSTRPEENQNHIVFDPHKCPVEVGEWFKRWDGDGRVFVSNLQLEYPDD